mgnify:CR=1 FL=1
MYQKHHQAITQRVRSPHTWPSALTLCVTFLSLLVACSRPLTYPTYQPTTPSARAPVSISILVFDDHRAPESRLADRLLPATYLGQPSTMARLAALWLAQELEVSGLFQHVEFVDPDLPAGALSFPVHPNATIPITGMRPGADVTPSNFGTLPRTLDVTNTPHGDLILQGSLESLESASFWTDIFSGKQELFAALQTGLTLSASHQGPAYLRESWSVQGVHSFQRPDSDVDAVRTTTVVPIVQLAEFQTRLRFAATTRGVTPQRPHLTAEHLVRALPALMQQLNKTVVERVQKQLPQMVADMADRKKPSRQMTVGTPPSPPAVGPLVDRSSLTPSAPPSTAQPPTTRATAPIQQAEAAPPPPPSKAPALASAHQARPAEKPTRELTTIMVQKGETLAGLAKKHRSSVAEIRALNHLDGLRVKPNQVLVIPAPRRAPATPP